jgi:hypothetical protein
MTDLINPGLVVKSDGVNDQGIPFPLADGVSHPGRRGILGVSSSVGEDLAHKVTEQSLFRESALFPWEN